MGSLKINDKGSIQVAGKVKPYPGMSNGRFDGNTGNILLSGKLHSSADGAPVPPVFPQPQIDAITASINQSNTDRNSVQQIIGRRGSAYWMSDGSDEGAGITKRYGIYDHSNWQNQQNWGAPAQQVYTQIGEKINSLNQQITDIKQKYQDDLTNYQTAAKAYASTNPEIIKAQAESMAVLSASNNKKYIVIALIVVAVIGIGVFIWWKIKKK